MRVVIAEDLVLLRDGLARALRAHGATVVAEVGDAGALLEAVAEFHPDLALVDIRMPPTFRDEGARATVFIRDRFPDVAVLILSHTIDPDIALALAAERPAGFGYLLKDRVLDVEEFVESCRAVTAGETVLDPAVVKAGLANRREPLSALSERERDVLAGLAQGRSNVAIAASLFISERTVDAHLRSIFVKLGLPPAADTNRRVQAALTWLRSAGESSVLAPMP